MKKFAVILTAFGLVAGLAFAGYSAESKVSCLGKCNKAKRACEDEAKKGPSKEIKQKTDECEKKSEECKKECK